jgi:1-pyrroline-5-carboxylate dehydrogenase
MLSKFASRSAALRVAPRRFFASPPYVGIPKHGDLAPKGTVVPSWATCNPETMSASEPCQLYNLCNGEWTKASSNTDIPDPLNGDNFIQMPNTKGAELQPFIDAAKSCPKSGLHNPFKNPERYVNYGEVCFRAGVELSKPEVLDYFAKLISRVMPKSYFQAWYETKVSADFLKNWGGDNPRFNATTLATHVPGDHGGQMSAGYRWP